MCRRTWIGLGMIVALLVGSGVPAARGAGRVDGREYTLRWAMPRGYRTHFVDRVDMELPEPDGVHAAFSGVMTVESDKNGNPQRNTTKLDPGSGADVDDIAHQQWVPMPDGVALSVGDSWTIKGDQVWVPAIPGSKLAVDECLFKEVRWIGGHPVAVVQERINIPYGSGDKVGTIGLSGTAFIVLDSGQLISRDLSGQVIRPLMHRGVSGRVTVHQESVRLAPANVIPE